MTGTGEGPSALDVKHCLHYSTGQFVSGNMCLILSCLPRLACRPVQHIPPRTGTNRRSSALGWHCKVPAPFVPQEWSTRIAV